MALGPNWKAIGVARWFDPMLGKFTDRKLAKLVGTTERHISRRRHLFGIEAYSVKQAIEPFANLLGVESDESIATKCGASVRSVRVYRQSKGILPRSQVQRREQRLPMGHPVRPFKDVLKLVSAEDIAKAAGVPVQVVLQVCEDFGIQSPTHEDQVVTLPLLDVSGPWLGFESLLGSMSSARISRAVGVPLEVVKRRREFLGVDYQRIAKAERFTHLFGLVPNSVIAKLAGVSAVRIADMRKSAVRQETI